MISKPFKAAQSYRLDHLVAMLAQSGSQPLVGNRINPGRQAECERL
jgi:hypothetical protein